MKYVIANPKGIGARYKKLTPGKIYEVLYEDSEYYKVINDNGISESFYKSRFLQECNPGVCITRKCNSCPLSK